MGKLLLVSGLGAWAAFSGLASRAFAASSTEHFSPALIMEDLLEYPRFQMKVLNELIPESQLPGMVTDLRQKASALVLQAKQKKEQQNPDGSEDNKTNGKHHANDTQVIHDPVVVRAGKKYKFLCRVPRIEHRLAATTSMTEDSGAAKPKEHDKNKTNDSKEKNSEERGAVDDPRNNERQAIQRGLELLSPLKSNCISYAVDWWTYEYCHGQFVRQYHKFEASENREAVVIQFKLGDHSKRKRLLTLPSGTNGHRRHGTTNNEVGSNAEDDEDANEAFRTTQIKRVGRKQFLAQTWAGGTVCDVTRKPREVEIQFHCDPNNPERISQVKETAVCQYLMIINTPRLCVDPGFYDSAASTIYDIACQEVVSDKRYQSILAKNALPDNTANAGAGLSKAADDVAATKDKSLAADAKARKKSERSSEQPVKRSEATKAGGSESANEAEKAKARPKIQIRDMALDPKDAERLAQLQKREKELRRLLEKALGDLDIQIMLPTNPQSAKKQLQKEIEKALNAVKEKRQQKKQQQSDEPKQQQDKQQQDKQQQKPLQKPVRHEEL